MQARNVERVVDRLRREVDETVAQCARDGLFVHAGVVAWRGRAILVPGRSMSGKSHLTAELVRCGATYYSDEFAVLNDDGMVRPYARAPINRANRANRAAARPARGEVPERPGAEQPLPIALVVSSVYRAGSAWQPDEIRGARAVLPIIDNTVLARSASAHLLRLCRRVAPSVVTLQGLRGDAAIVAPRILAYLDALLDGDAIARARPPRTCGDRRTRTRRPGRGGRLRRESLARVDGSAVRSLHSASRTDAPLLDEDCILLLHWNGRFGNRMHQYAYGVTYARLNRCAFWLPSDWEGTHLFATQHHVLAPHAGLRASLNEAKHAKPRAHDSHLAQRVIPRVAAHQRRRSRVSTTGRTARPSALTASAPMSPSIFAKMSRRASAVGLRALRGGAEPRSLQAARRPAGHLRHRPSAPR